jgi:RNA polymerase sigma-70 factor (ECF subfamily)
MDAFLREVEARAYRITLTHVRDADDALDIVQDAMIKLVRRYAKRPAEEWTPLFYRILQNKTRDWHRRQKVKQRVFGFFSRDDEDSEDTFANVPASPESEPTGQLEREDAMHALEHALGELPDRQREAFMLRNFEGLDVRETARAMGCTEGSVKTHYSRALQRLKAELGEHWS